MPDRLLSLARQTLQVLVVLAAVAYALDIYRQVFGLVLYTEQVLAICLGLAMGIVFLGRATELAGWLRWSYVAAAALSLASVTYICVNYPTLSLMAALLPVDAVTASLILVVLLLEAVRLSAGRGILVVVLLFLLYGLLGHLAPGDFRSRYASPSELAVYLAIDPSGALGVAIKVAVIVVVPYVLFGQMLARLGAADFFNDISMTAMGRFPGRPGQSRDLGLGSVRHDLGHGGRQRRGDRRRDDPDDEAIRGERARRGRDRGPSPRPGDSSSRR